MNAALFRMGHVLEAMWLGAGGTGAPASEGADPGRARAVEGPTEAGAGARARDPGAMAGEGGEAGPTAAGVDAAREVEAGAAPSSRAEAARPSGTARGDMSAGTGDRGAEDMSSGTDDGRRLRGCYGGGGATTATP
ncbi:hypothetical protein SAMN02745121_01966 [Nannocystis exedens]|uniref:Uncharacterized protein n=1 Tax=Nannocystis exedens TaxID=54 RepID=A0A1I1VZL7_9BACT|nr:hypothetical protein NAEX_05934 [Nannocystis exedens]SFD86513.1 hypothetical protein SAMN02745121_01966 [Nannocystis exedens]